MTLSNTQKNPENTTLDLAEQLKASLANELTMADMPASPDEEDDLAALLRAQLSQTDAFNNRQKELTPPQDRSDPEPLTPSVDSNEDDVATIPMPFDLMDADETDAKLSALSQRNTDVLREQITEPLAQVDTPPISKEKPGETSDEGSVSDAKPATGLAAEATGTDQATSPGKEPTASRLHESAPPIVPYAAPMQADFPSHATLHPTSGKKPPRVSRMFGVYRIQAAPPAPSSDARPSEPVKGANANSSHTVEAYTEHMDVPGSREAETKDIAMSISLGHEHDLRSPDERTLVDDVRHDAHASVDPTPRRETAAVRDIREYTDPKQNDAIQAAYRRSLFQQPILFLLAFAGSVLTLLYDLLPLLDLKDSFFADFINTAFYPTIEIELLLIICLPFLTRLHRGIMSLLDFEPTRYALPAMSLLFTLLHALIACFAPIGDGTLPLFGGVALLMLALAALSEALATAGERLAFHAVSAEKDSFVLTDESTPAAKTYIDAPEMEALHQPEHVLTAVRTHRVADYFARTARYNPYMGRLNYLLPVSLLLAIAAAGITIIRGGNPLYDGIRVFTGTYLACLPCGYLLSMALPLLISNRRLSKIGAAVIGTAAPAEHVHRGHTAIILPDNALIDLNGCVERALRDDPYADWYAQLTSILYQLLEMPGAENRPLPEGVYLEIAEREDDYLRVYLITPRTDARGREAQGAMEIMLGSYEALLRRGIRLPKPGGEHTYSGDPRERVLYMAYDRRFRRLSAATPVYDRVTLAARRMDVTKDMLVISSYDPLLDVTALRKHAPSVTVVQPTYIELHHTTHSGAFVATEAASDLIDAYSAAYRMKRTYQIAQLLSWIWLPLVAGTIITAVFLGAGQLITTPTVALMQLLASVCMSVVALLECRSQKEKEPKAETTIDDTADAECNTIQETTATEAEDVSATQAVSSEAPPTNPPMAAQLTVSPSAMTADGEAERSALPEPMDSVSDPIPPAEGDSANDVSNDEHTAMPAEISSEQGESVAVASTDAPKVQAPTTTTEKEQIP